MSENQVPNKAEAEAIKVAAKAAGIRKSARKSDVLDHFRGGKFTLDTMNSYFAKQKETRPHWFKGMDGDGGSNTTKTKNPWSREGWSVTNQGACVRSMGLDRAASLAESAGSRIGATKPPER